MGWRDVTFGNASKTFEAPSTGDVVALIALSGLAVLTMVRLRSLWVSPCGNQDPRECATADTPARMALRRGAPVSIVTLVAFVLTGWSSVLLHFSQSLFVVIPIVVLLCLTIVGFLLTWTVIAVRRPRRLVPPVLRDLPGPSLRTPVS